MSVVQPSLQERRQAPKAALNFASNNPFRNRATSPSNAPSATSPPQILSDENSNPRAIHTNPFLDTYQPSSEFNPAKPTAAPPMQGMPFEFANSSSKGVSPVDRTADLMNGLALDHKPTSEIKGNTQVSGSELHAPAPESARHRVTRSQDEDRRPRPRQDDERRPRRDPRVHRENRDQRRDQPPDYAAVTRSPEKREVRKPMPRRNSDTSVIEVLDDERKTKESKDGRSRDPRSREGRSGRSGKPSRRVDLIDKLDVTGIYGSTTFHHDGPFDACNPHRNRRTARAAPMRAFAEGSANMALGGSGPVNKGIDFEQFHGRGAQGYADYNATQTIPAEAYPGYRRGGADPRRADKYPNLNLVDPKAHTQYLIGSESAGLGTSTFLEGTPVSRSVLQRRESDNDPTSPEGLQRKKSLAQKIRGISRPRPGVDYQDSRGVSYPEMNCVDPETGAVLSPLQPLSVQSAGGRAKMSTERNPFFVDANNGAKEPSVDPPKQVDPEQDALVTVTRARTASSPQRPLGRRPTMENGQTDAADAKPSTGGLLNRVKSLKGGKRNRPERSGSASQDAERVDS